MHGLHLHILLTLILSLLLPLPLLTEATLAHLPLLLVDVSLLEALLLNECWIRLHVDWNYERGKSVATNDSTIVHDVLRGDFAVMN